MHIAWWVTPFIVIVALGGTMLIHSIPKVPPRWDRLHWFLGEFLIPIAVALVCLFIASILHGARP